MAKAASGTAGLLQELLYTLGTITVRRMFGGAGVYCDGVIFALIIDDIAFFKADVGSIKAFEAEDMGPFTYETKLGDRAIMSYWQVPDRLFDEPDELLDWARRAVSDSLAAKRKIKSKSSGGMSASKGVVRR